MSSTPEPARLPKLTEEVAPGSDAGKRETAAAPAADDALEQRVLADLMQRVDSVLESHMRDALAPALARASDTLIRELRAELAETLREVVARAVERELARRRDA